MACEGSFRTMSDSIGHASQRPWTRLDEWPDRIRSRSAPDTFPDPSPESDLSRFARSLNLPGVVFACSYRSCKYCQSFFERMVSARTLGFLPLIVDRERLSEYDQEGACRCGLFGDGAAADFAANVGGLCHLCCVCVFMLKLYAFSVGL